MATEPLTAEIVALPSPLAIPEGELKTSILSLERDALALPGLKAQAQSIQISDAATYAQVGGILTEVRVIKDTPQNRLGSFYTIVRRVLTFLDTQSNKVKNACTEVEAICKSKMKEYEFKEREAAQKEEQALNKKADTPVTVKPNLPSVAGYRKTVNYYATFDTPADFDKLLRRFFTTKSRDERTYLRKFLSWDESALNKEAREVKDPKELMKKIPGSRAWSA